MIRNLLSFLVTHLQPNSVGIPFLFFSHIIYPIRPLICVWILLVMGTTVAHFSLLGVVSIILTIRLVILVTIRVLILIVVILVHAIIEGIALHVHTTLSIMIALLPVLELTVIWGAAIILISVTNISSLVVPHISSTILIVDIIEPLLVIVASLVILPPELMIFARTMFVVIVSVFMPVIVVNSYVVGEARIVVVILFVMRIRGAIVILILNLVPFIMLPYLVLISLRILHALATSC